MTFEPPGYLTMMRLLLTVVGACVLAPVAHAQQHQKGPKPKVRVDTTHALASSPACDRAKSKGSADPDMIVCPDSSWTADMRHFKPKGQVDPDMAFDPWRGNAGAVTVKGDREALKDSSMHGREQREQDGSDK